jgi:hypothetical protein
VISRIYENAKIKEQALIDVRCVLDIASIYGEKAMEEVSRRALKDFHMITYNTLIPYIKDISKSKKTKWSLRMEKNINTASYGARIITKRMVQSNEYRNKKTISCIGAGRFVSCHRKSGEGYERKSKFIYEFIEQRCGNSPTIFVGQYDVEDWHDCYRSHLICNNTIMVFWDGSQA